MSGVDISRWEVGREFKLDIHRLRNRALYQLANFPYQLRQINRSNIQAAFASICEHLPGQFSGTLAGADDILQRALIGRARRSLPKGEPRITQNSRKQIIEVVSDASRENPQALQSCRLLKLVIELFAFRDIADIELRHIPRTFLIQVRHDFDQDFPLTIASL